MERLSSRFGAAAIVLVLFLALCKASPKYLGYSDRNVEEHPLSRTKRQAYPSEKVGLSVDGQGQGETGPWGSWNVEVECSRTCGGGVQVETRKCTQGQKCTGAAKRYVSCNVEACSGDAKDLRSEQCSAYDSKPFEGKYLTWVPYLKAPKCELLCQPEGQSWYYRFQDKVIDGTKCDSLSNDICVDGICLALGCDGRLGSTSKEDKCGVCNGDGSTCKTQESLFEVTPPAVGYINIVTIPAGATSIVVQERRAVDTNYLAIRNASNFYYLNGDWKIDFPGTIEVAGTVFEYERGSAHGSPEKLVARGPLKDDVTIELLYQATSKGKVAIKYEYSVPLDESVAYELQAGPWSDCSVTCGQGVKTRDLECIDRSTKGRVFEDLCTNSSRPEANVSCNTVDCPADWFIGKWEECSATCGVVGLQYRVVYCHRVLADGSRVTVDDSVCKTDRPAYQQSCNRFTCPEWNAGPWSACSKACGDAEQYRSVSCRSQKPQDELKLRPASECGIDKQPVAKRGCNLGPCEGMHWVTSAWKLCERCNDTTETRNVSCHDESNRRYPDDKCSDVGERPLDTRECATPVPCNYKWHATQWGECSTKCGHGHQTRSVICAIEERKGVYQKMDELHCDPSLKQNATQNCTNEVECKGTYFSTDWSACSASCGGGKQERKVLCFNYEYKLDPKGCDERELPNLVQECNTAPCIDCKTTEFGCCPDNVTVAGGPYRENCSNCSTSEFGCCPDNYTIAEGPDMAGCEVLPTDDTTVEGSGELTPGGSEAMCNYTSAAGVTLEIACVNLTLYENMTAAENETAIDEDMDVNATKHCSKSEYGCCPDWYTDAEGPNYAGCPTYETGTCNGTEFGCCPDDVTLARGPNSEGCGTPECSASLFGCCQDRRTIAFGPHYEGCERGSLTCEGSEYGCCPDGETTALGLAGEGCGEECLLTKYGCCLDGKTAATGPGFGGCGCAVSQYGCCSDGKTAAEGPNRGGCPETCATTYYGCCPDGKTRQEGPNLQGCPCKFQPHGCCPDGTTTARGPNLAGCDDCAITEFGCCPDGITKARGPGFAGCFPETTPSPHVGGPKSPAQYMACNLPSEIGNVCGSYSLRWFFNTTIGQCAQFWYGGCDGNENRFESSEECRDTCVSPTGDGVCYLGAVPGQPGCGNAQVKWHYSHDTHTCEAFYWYCTGNDNAFDSSDECYAKCGHLRNGGGNEGQHVVYTEPYVVITSTQTQPPPTRRPGGSGNTGVVQVKFLSNGRERTLTGKDAIRQWLFTRRGYPGILPDMDAACSENADQGPCDSYSEQYYYNPVSGQCSAFVYGGCGGNQNRFATLAECEQRCGGRQATDGNVCDMRVDPGPCKGIFWQWGYERAMGACQQFVYGGCGGNENRFRTREHCEQTCVRGRRTADIITKVDQTKERCNLPRDPGSCNDYQVYWHYSPTDGECLRFYFGGCGGNANRFQSHLECTTTCGQRAEALMVEPGHGQIRDGWANELDDHNNAAGTNDVQVEKVPKQDHSESANYHYRRSVRCQLPMQSGGCSKEISRWFFDLYTGECVPFKYTGCDGNENNFATKAECELECATERLGTVNAPRPQISTKTEKTYPLPTSILPDLCKYAKDAGTCFGEELSWYFDWESQQCETMMWTGCGGNSNRFSSFEACQRACGAFRDQDVCVLMPDEGPCLSALPKFYHDAESKTCKPFMFGGCKGNGNRFSSQEECESLCEHEARPVTDICRLPVATGPCQANIPKWFFDVDSGTCQQFMYGGCSGNENRFDSQAFCESHCIGKQLAKDVCTMPRDPGPCTEPITQWFFNQEDAQCKPFTYGGCRGNGNRFAAKHICEATCKGLPVGRLLENAAAVCALGFERGPCKDAVQRWYYDLSSRDCKPFVYSGCYGNENRFLTKDICMDSCGGVERHMSSANDTAVVPENEPEIIKVRVESQSVAAGVTVTLTCVRVKDETAVTDAMWFRNAVLLTPADHVEVLINGTLRLKEVTPIDQGEYTCSRGNGAKSISDPVSIKVASLPASTTTTASTRSTCVDNVLFHDCPKVMQANLCDHPYYGKFCCATCRSDKTLV